MKTFIGILLIGLLGFSGCSSSNDGTSTTANVGKAIAVEPFGIEDAMTPTYGWTPVQSATRYRLLVQEAIEDSTAQDTTETYVIDEWYTPEEAGCTSEEDLCMVAPDIDVDGAYTWKVMACAGDDCGLWSDGLQFSYPPPAIPRFTDNGDDTVTDTHTGLMWTKDANLFGTKNWSDATSYCWDLTLANHSDWSLPYISEINALIDETQVDPALPPDNPFTNVQSDVYWSSTTDSYQTNYAWGVHLGDGSVGYGEKSNEIDVWCVRGDGRAVPDPYDGGCPNDSCQENSGPYRVYLFERIRGAIVPLEHFGFNLLSWAHSCKDWKKSVSSLGNQLTVNTGTCKSEKSNVNWIKNEVINKGYTPISWATRYVAANRNESGKPSAPPNDLNFVIYGDFKPTIFWKNYTCPNVMIGMETWGFGSNSWWFISNTTEPRTEGSGTWVVLKCTEDASGRPVVLEVNGKYGQRTKGANSFMVSVRQ